MQETTMMMSNIRYDDAELYVVHCFDPRPLWLSVWKSVCPRGILIGRFPLAGASARGKHYVSYFKERANKLAPIVFVTHYPCGWYEGKEESVVFDHGKEVVDTLSHAGFAAIHIHFSLSKQSWKMSRRVYDPCDLNQSEKAISQIINQTNSFENQAYKESDLTMKHRIELLVMAKEVYGPPQDGPTLIVSGDMLPRDAIEIIEKMNGDNQPVSLYTTSRFYAPNY